MDTPHLTSAGSYEVPPESARRVTIDAVLDGHQFAPGSPRVRIGDQEFPCQAVRQVAVHADETPRRPPAIGVLASRPENPVVEVVLRLQGELNERGDVYRLTRHVVPVRPTAGITTLDDQPLDRDQYTQQLQHTANRASGRLVPVQDGEAEAIADLLDELAAVYRGEPMGDLARTLAVRLNDRRGV